LIEDGESTASVEQFVAELKRESSEGIKAIWRSGLNASVKQSDLYNQGVCYAQLGETNAGLNCLEKLLSQHDNVLTFEIMTDWKLDPLRSHPRFHAILSRMHFE
jgi:hypothetical protein